MATETGLKHDWFLPSERGYRLLFDVNGVEVECCRACGVVKPRDPALHSRATCRGQVHIGLRSRVELADAI
jgi:hypothetical protein